MYAQNNKLDSPRKYTAQESDLDLFRSFSNSVGGLGFGSNNLVFSLNLRADIEAMLAWKKIREYKHPILVCI